MEATVAEFQQAFLKMQKHTYQTAKEHGFHEINENPLQVPTRLALIMSECVEALECHRSGEDDKLAHELADVIIRTMDLAEVLGIDLGTAVAEKAAFNTTREKYHGNKRY